jgi:lysophospholipase L1-like esterase
VRTVFTTAYRQVALDLSEPRIGEGMRITKELLPRIKRKTDAAGAHLLILLIPTKESAHAEALRARGRRLDPTLESLASWESRARAEIVSTCEGEGIEYADALPALTAAIGRGEQLYPTGTESHPNARGYAVLASTVGDALAKRGW